LDNSKPVAHDVTVTAVRNLDQARKAIDNYLTFFQTGMSATPWTRTDLNKTLLEYTRRNVDVAFEFAQKLAQAKNLQDMVQIQAEYLQTHMKSFTQQATDLAEIASKATTSAIGAGQRLS
jgi:hypothetical protein